MIIAFTGTKGSGKSLAATAAANCFKDRNNFAVLRCSFAAPLKAMLTALGVPASALYGSDIEKNTPQNVLRGRSTRYAMQTLGTEWGRNCMGSDMWTSKLLDTMTNFAYELNDTQIPIYIVDDLRFADEAEFLKTLGGKIIRVFRKVDSYMQDTHQSELDMQKIDPDFVLMNTTTKEFFEQEATKLVLKICKELF